MSFSSGKNSEIPCALLWMWYGWCVLWNPSPRPPPGDLPDPGIKLCTADRLFTSEPPGRPQGPTHCGATEPNCAATNEPVYFRAHEPQLEKTPELQWRPNTAKIKKQNKTWGKKLIVSFNDRNHYFNTVIWAFKYTWFRFWILCQAN